MQNTKQILTCYLAGGISAYTKREQGLPWREEAMQKLAQRGLIAVCPMTHGVEGPKSEEDKKDPARQAKVFEVDCDLIYRSDCLIVNMEVISFGTAQEMFYADQILRIPVFVFNNKGCTSAFLFNTSYRVCDTLDDAIAAVELMNSQGGRYNSVADRVERRDNHYQIPPARLKPRHRGVE